MLKGDRGGGNQRHVVEQIVDVATTEQLTAVLEWLALRQIR